MQVPSAGIDNRFQFLHRQNLIDRWSLISHRAGGKKSIDYPEQGSIESTRGRLSNLPKSNDGSKQSLMYFQKVKIQDPVSLSASARAWNHRFALCFVMCSGRFTQSRQIPR